MNDTQSSEKENFGLNLKPIKEDKLIFLLNEESQTAYVIGNDKASGDVLIPRSIKHETQEFIVTSINEGSFKYSDTIRSLQFPPDSELQKIEKDAFRGSTIESITIPPTLSELKDGWCARTSKLLRISVDSNNQHFKKIEGNLIVGKSDSNNDEFDVLIFAPRNIKTINLPSNIKQISPYAFSESIIESITIPETVFELKEGWCAETPKLKKVTISSSNEQFKNIDDKLIVGKSDTNKDDFDVLVFASRDTRTIKIPSNITRIASYAFSRSMIESIVISPHITHISSNAFSYCKQLQKVDIPADSKLQSIEKEAFRNTSIESIFVPAHITQISEGTFSYCDQLQNVQFPQDSMLRVIGKDAFSESSIESLAIPSSVLELQDGWCSETAELTRVTVMPCKLQNISMLDDTFIVGKSDFMRKDYDVLIFARRDVKTATIPPSIRQIAPFAFSKSEIESIKISPHLTKICEGAFMSCKKLQHVEIPPDSELQVIEKNAFSWSIIESIFIPPHVTQICEYAFAYCEQLQRAEIAINSELRIINKYAFYWSKIESIFIPPHVTHICERAFSNCKQLQRIEIAMNSELISIEYEAFAYSAIESIYIPLHITKICERAFYLCSKLNRVEIPPDSELSIIEKLAFSGSIIEGIFIPPHLTKICGRAFYLCSKLKRVDIPPDSELKTIEKEAFKGTSVDNISIPSSVTELKDGWCDGTLKSTNVTVMPNT